jgi:hypothetical protein
MIEYELEALDGELLLSHATCHAFMDSRIKVVIFLVSIFLVGK